MKRLALIALAATLSTQVLAQKKTPKQLEGDQQVVDINLELDRARLAHKQFKEEHEALDKEYKSAEALYNKYHEDQKGKYQKVWPDFTGENKKREQEAYEKMIVARANLWPQHDKYMELQRKAREAKRTLSNAEAVFNAAKEK